MKIVIHLLLIWLVTASTVFARELRFTYPDGDIIIPESSLPHPGEDRASTGLIIFKPKEKSLTTLPRGETPASLACVYGLTTPVPGCRREDATELPTGGWGAIALVDAFHNPNAESDLNVYSTQFGLPACTTANGCFNLVFASGSQPPDGWQDEQALDIEMAHAMAPNAKIYLVEAASDSTADLLVAEDVAKGLVAAAGGGIVSNSWAGPESADETSRDSHFIQDGVIFIASSGDSSAPAKYPSSSPNVISAGGTSLNRDSAGNFISETSWGTSGIPGQPGSSGGPSVYEARPSYQNIVQRIAGNHRGTPDISFDANPRTGVAVYSTHSGGWIVDGGTSAASPALAGIINSANHRKTSTHEELTYIYGNYAKNAQAYWHDILIGNNGYPSLNGYDFVTGLGSPRGYEGK